jgi:hypothetical protein
MPMPFHKNGIFLHTGILINTHLLKVIPFGQQTIPMGMFKMTPRHRIDISPLHILLPNALHRPTYSLIPGQPRFIPQQSSIVQFPTSLAIPIEKFFTHRTGLEVQGIYGEV